VDIRARGTVAALFQAERFDVIIHCAAQPSHDLARSRPLDDFDVNAVGTINLLEAARQSCPEAPFVTMSTNKVYGDAPNEIPVVELATRYEYARPEDRAGVDESCRIDASTHSIFGASKVAADVMTQEYGRYFGMPTCVLRGGCITGARHSGVPLHGFLNYLVRAVLSGERYTIIGYKGKQVRDQLHAFDLVRAMHVFAENPRAGEVYNMGGGAANSISVLEAISRTEALTGKSLQAGYEPNPRTGDHICYYSNLGRFQAHYPQWSVTRTLDDILEEMLRSEWAQQGESKHGAAVGSSASRAEALAGAV
jgi:CDP-paratose 2-epimerase